MRKVLPPPLHPRAGRALPHYRNPRDPRPDELSPVCLPQIQRVPTEQIPRKNLPQFLSNLVAANSNRRPHRRHQIRDITPKFLPHPRNSQLNDSACRTSPTCMKSSNDAFFNVRHKHRNAICRHNPEQQSPLCCHQSIPHNRSLARHKDLHPMHLPHHHQRPSSPHPLHDELPIPCHRRRIVLFRKPQVQFLRPVDRRHPSYTRSKPMPKPRVYPPFINLHQVNPSHSSFLLFKRLSACNDAWEYTAK